MIKLKEAKYYEKDGYSEAIIETEIGCFMGHAFLHPDDESKASSFLGCEIAEYRATILYYKKLIKILNIEINTLKDIQFKTPEITKKINQKIQQKEIYKKDIKTLTKVIEDKVEVRLLVLDKIEKKKQKEEDK